MKLKPKTITFFFSVMVRNWHLFLVSKTSFIVVVVPFISFTIAVYFIL